LVNNMRKIILIFLINLVSITSYSAPHKLTAKEFTDLYDQGKISFEVMPIGRNLALALMMKINNETDRSKIPHPLLLQIEKELINDYKSKYIYFREDFFNVRYLDDGVWRYSVSFDFATDRKCKLRVERIDPKCGNPVCEGIEDPSSHKNVDISGTVINDSYCEKIYGVKLN
jgi:hypothetical protein